MQSPEKKQVLEAIQSLGRRVTAADVAAKTGLALHLATSQLNTVAAETNGHLQVSNTGDIAYEFAPGFQSAYLATGIKRTLEQIGSKAFEIGFYLLRISFGIMLILSLLIIVVLLIVIALAQRGDNDRDEGFSFDFFDYMLLRDLFWYTAWSNPTPSYYDTIGYHEPYSRKRDKGNFLLNCFSFLFGDGNPNAHLDERRWQLIPQIIRHNNGVVTSEQIAPYTGADPKNEDGMLPVLVRFEGRPEVTDTGNIVYVFPNLQVSAASRLESGLPAFLNEFPWQFSDCSVDSLIPVYAVATANFVGAWWLFTIVAKSATLAALAPLTGLLVIYGTLFVAIPFIRWLCIKWMNRHVEERNRVRRGYANQLSNPLPELVTKLTQASNYEIKEQQITADKIIYTTEKDALDQKDELDEKFEKLEGKSKPPSNPAGQISSDKDKEALKIKLDREALEREFDASP